MEYKSITEAERQNGIYRQGIAKVINSNDKNKTVGGYHWKKIEEPIHKIRRGGRRVKCVETGVVYNSLTEAGEEVGIDRRNIGNALKKGKKYAAGGFHWEYAD